MVRSYWERIGRAARLLGSLSSTQHRTPAPEEVSVMIDDQRVDRYAPRVPSGPALVLLHGVTARGASDRRLVALARALAAEGVTAFVPQLRGLAEFREDPADLTRIKRAIDLASNRGSQPTSLLGFSLGAGLGLVSAADPDVAGKIARVVAVGAHHRLDAIWDSLSVRLKALPARLEAATDGELYCALGLASQRLNEQALGPVAADELRTLLWNYCDSKDLEPIRRFVRMRLLPHWPDIERSQTSEQSLVLSPAGRLRRVVVPVALLHAPDDELVPEEHARLNFAELQQRKSGEQTLLSTALLDHVRPRIARGLWQIPSLVRHFAELI